MAESWFSTWDILLGNVDIADSLSLRILLMARLI